MEKKLDLLHEITLTLEDMGIDTSYIWDKIKESLDEGEDIGNQEPSGNR